MFPEEYTWSLLQSNTLKQNKQICSILTLSAAFKSSVANK